MTYKEAQESYKRLQEKKANLPEHDKKWLDKIHAYKINIRYDVKTDKMKMLAELYNNSMLDAFNTIFRIGYIAGQKALKAEQKKQGGIIYASFTCVA